MTNSNLFAQARFPAASPEEAMRLLSGKEARLPSWALILCKSLPRATAGMVDLDYFHRVDNPLGPVFAGKLRWIAADVNRCDYAKRYAEADLTRLGLKEADWVNLKGPGKDLPEAERLALAFARKMSRAAYQVTDEEITRLLEEFGPEKLVAIVHTLAHANFQNRIFLALGVEVEKEGPLPPVKLAPDAAHKPGGAKRLPWEEVLASKISVPEDMPAWKVHGLEEIRKAVEEQKARKPRIPFAGPDRLDKLPPPLRERALRSSWSRVSLGYQPGLTMAWFDTMGKFMEEAQQEPKFANRFFWVVTRTNECFY